MNFDNITIGEIVVLIAGVTAITGFITKLTSPFTDLKTRIEKIEQHQDNDNKRLEELEKDTKMILKATRVLVAHSVSNNNTGELKRVQEEIDNYLINK